MSFTLQGFRITKPSARLEQLYASSTARLNTLRSETSQCTSWRASNNASGKGGVGKSTVAVNLAAALTCQSIDGRNPRVGLLDLDIFGPSVPKLMGLEGLPPPELTKAGAIILFSNHGLHPSPSAFWSLKPTSIPRSYKGLMVQKVPNSAYFMLTEELTLGQLVQVDGATIVSTPQDVPLIDAKKGVAMFHKVHAPIIGFLLNMVHFTCSTCSTSHNVFGPLASFHQTADALNLKILGELPVTPSVSADGDSGSPTTLRSGRTGNMQGVGEVQSVKYSR